MERAYRVLKERHKSADDSRELQMFSTAVVPLAGMPQSWCELSLAMLNVGEDGELLQSLSRPYRLTNKLLQLSLLNGTRTRVLVGE